MYLLRNRAIDHPRDFAVGRAHDLGGIFVGVGWTFDDGVQRVYFVRACRQEEHMMGRVQDGRREGQAIRRRLAGGSVSRQARSAA